MAVGALVALLNHAASAHPLKLSTWNMDWLTDRPAGDPDFPPDVGRRTSADFSDLARYAAHLNADIIGLQEVDSVTAAHRVFPAGRYRIILSEDAIPQRVGLAVRGGIQVTENPLYQALAVVSPAIHHPLRSGLDLTLTDGDTVLRVLVVHLKTGCWDAAPTDRGHSCPILRQQMAVLNDWVLQRRDEGVPFAILGDFNRRLTSADPFMRALDAASPLTLVTAGKASPCWGGEYFIDHILLGNKARGWLVPNSLRVMTYQGASSARRSSLSDHCPVSVTLSLPDHPSGDGAAPDHG